MITDITPIPNFYLISAHDQVAARLLEFATMRAMDAAHNTSAATGAMVPGAALELRGGESGKPCKLRMRSAQARSPSPHSPHRQLSYNTHVCRPHRSHYRITNLHALSFAISPKIVSNTAFCRSRQTSSTSARPTSLSLLQGPMPARSSVSFVRQCEINLHQSIQLDMLLVQ